MSLRNSRELESTRKKLAMLQQQVVELQQDANATRRADVLTLRSLTQLINQLKEEIAQYEARIPA